MARNIIKSSSNSNNNIFFIALALQAEILLVIRLALEVV